MKALVLPFLEGLLAILRLLPQKPVQAPKLEQLPLLTEQPNAITRHLEKHQRIAKAYDRLNSDLKQN